MKYIYVDNYRGFSQTVLPLKDVNFLVGENSTGKSSLLHLIYLFSTPEFWATSAFNTPQAELGNFYDIVSVSSPDQTSFTIGLIETGIKKKDSEDNKGFLLTFIEKSGMPTISHFTFLNDKKLITVKYEKGRAKYKLSDFDLIDRDIKSIEKLFLDWQAEHRDQSNGYVSIKKSRNIMDREQLLLIPYALASDKIRTSSFVNYLAGSIFPRLAWIAPIRTKPKRTYDDFKRDFSPEGEHTPSLIKSTISSRTSKRPFVKYMERIGNESGLFDSLAVRKYSVGKYTPFELDIVLNNKSLYIGNVGYGVSQSLPIFVELFARINETVYLIQQPEVHLHPRAQACLGKLFFEFSINDKKQFIVETHSDFIIDGFRVNYKTANPDKKPLAQILFFDRTPTGNRLYPIEILENGELSANQPKAYRDFFVKEQLQLLGL